MTAGGPSSSEACVRRVWRTGRRLRRSSGITWETTPESAAAPAGEFTPTERCSFIDELPPEWRRLINEYGWEIVGRMINDRYPALPNIEDTEFALMQWRWKRQMQWLETDYITPQVAEGFRRAFRRLRPSSRGFQASALPEPSPDQ
jgi:hypothetical protein